MALPSSFIERAAPTIELTDKSETRTRHFYVGQTDVESLIEELYPQDIAGGSTYVRARIASYPGKPWLVLTGVNFAPADRDNIDGTNAYGVGTCSSGYFVDLTYESNPGKSGYNVLSFDIDVGGEWMKISSSGDKGIQWANANAAGDTHLGEESFVRVFIPKETWRVTWHRVYYPPFTAMSELSGLVNDSQILNGAAETVLYMGSQVTEDQDKKGNYFYDIAHTFVKQQITFTDAGGSEATAGWNHVFRDDVDPAAEDQWQKTDPLAHRLGDMKKLFQAEPSLTIRQQLLSDFNLPDDSTNQNAAIAGQGT